MDCRKRIALLVGQAEEEYQEKFISGFLSQVFAMDYDVCVFAVYQRWQESKARQLGESSIFSMIEYDQFDAVVLMLDTIQMPEIAHKIEETVKHCFNGPVLCVDIESRYFPHIEMDYYKTIKNTISHLIEQHGFTDIAYLTGQKGHKHAMRRLQAYIDCMKEHGLKVAKERIFYGDFWYSSGEQMVEQLLKQGGKLPQAIACANDYMAIGVAKKLTEHGLRVPEDIAIVSYDSVKAGKESPKPLTSVPIATNKYGVYAANCLEALIEGKEFPAYENNEELFIGSSCGCHNDSVIPRILLRERWDTEMSERVFYSPTNHMNEDLLCQTTFYDLMKTLDDYVYQIRDFDSFHICLNEDWNDFEKKAKEGRLNEIFSGRMLHALKCEKDENSQDVVSFDSYFPTKLMLPEIYEQHEFPSVYYFTPLYFEEKNFGYSVICYRNQCRSYSDTYRMWLRNVMQALECFRRMEAIQKNKQMLEASVTRDVLTGLYNYNGFSMQIEQLTRKIIQTGCSVGVLAVDIKELMNINEMHGRMEGDHAIIMLANILKETFHDGICVCLGNGEMIAVLLAQENMGKELQRRYDGMMARISAYNQIVEDYSLEVYCGKEIGSPRSNEELERLVNVAISKKNGNKVSERKLLNEKLTEEEYKEAQIVQNLLDENRFNYHFQPIVNARNGEIFGYEALMRPDVDPYLPPPVVLKYAEYYDRLYDVEKATFFNVLNLVNNNREIFDGNVKVFINSIPGNLLYGEDAIKLEAITKDLTDSVVVELTEQLELTDGGLTTLKNYYSQVSFQTAIDDYGTGYSNVTNLLRYMPHYVKIDRMLLTNIQDSPQKQHFVKDIITFCHDNDILVLAEGVETREELQMVIHLGVDLIQGYYTAKPAKDIISSIERSVKNEIIEFNKIEKHNRNRRVYVAGKESRISLARLAAEKYSIIEITDEETTSRDVTISGVPDMETNIYLRVKNGYRGRIILENVTLQGKKHGASIDIGNDCEVTIALQGDNHCLNGGVRVPEGSKLTIEGDGHLSIDVDAARYFGIGNGLDSKHGELVFVQDGTIEIKGSGMFGVGIGSGLGGEIHIRKGKYIIHLNGQEGIGIGAFHNDAKLIVKECDIRTDISTANAVGIGSLKGDVDLWFERLSYKGEFNAENVVGLGTLEGENCHIEMLHLNIVENVRANKLCGIGAMDGDVSVHLDNGAILVTGDAPEAIAFGNYPKTAQIEIHAGKMESRLKTALITDLGAEEQNIRIDNGECLYFMNGEAKILQA